MFPLQRFYESGCCAEPSDAERTHMSRFHTRSAAAMTTPARPSRRWVQIPHETIPWSFLLVHMPKTPNHRLSVFRVTCRQQGRISMSRFLLERTSSPRVCLSCSGRRSWSVSELERASTSPFTSEAPVDQILIVKLNDRFTRHVSYWVCILFWY